MPRSPLAVGDVVYYSTQRGPRNDFGRVVEIGAFGVAIRWLDGHVDQADPETGDLDGHDAYARRVDERRLRTVRHAAYVRCPIEDVDARFDPLDLPPGCSVYACRSGTLTELLEEYETVRVEVQESADNTGDHDEAVAVLCRPSACPLCLEVLVVAGVMEASDGV